MPSQEARPTIRIPGATSHTLAPRSGRHSDQGTLRCLRAGSGAPLVLLHTVRTRAEHFRSVVPLIADHRGGIAPSGLLARMVVSAVLAPGVGPVVAAVEPKAALRRILRGGLGDKKALREDYVDELLQVGGRPGYPVVARAVYQNLPGLIAARARYRDVRASVHLVYGEKDWSRPSDREADKKPLPAADYTQVPGAGHFIALERPEWVADLLNAVA